MKRLTFLMKKAESNEIYEVDVQYWALSGKRVDMFINVITEFKLGLNGFEEGWMLTEENYPVEYAMAYDKASDFLRKFFPYAEIVHNPHKFRDLK